MCGVFGFITKRGEGPNLAHLRRIATITQTRGRHAFGLAWITQPGAIDTLKRPGPASDCLDDLERARHAQVVVGHCRWATHGTPSDNRNNHPHAAGTGQIVHNGVVRNYQSIARHYALPLTSECDSEVLGRLIARLAGPLARRAACTAEVAEGKLAILGIWRRPTRLLVVRNGNPLCYAEQPEGLYFASLPSGMPGRAIEIADGYSGVLAFDGRALKRPDVYSIDPLPPRWSPAAEPPQAACATADAQLTLWD